MNEGRDSEPSLSATRALLLGPWGAALVAVCTAVIAGAIFTSGVL